MTKYGIGVTIETHDGDTIEIVDVFAAGAPYRDGERDTLGKSGMDAAVLSVGDGEVPTDRQYGAIDATMKLAPGAIRAVLAALAEAGTIGEFAVSPFCDTVEQIET